MSYFSDELKNQMDARGVTGLQLATRINLSASQISLWTRGVQTKVDADQLAAIQRALSDDPHDQARLVLAHLLDEKFGLHHEMVEVSMRSSAEMHDRPRHQSKGEAAIAFLAQERVRNPELNDMLIDLARLLQPAAPKNKRKTISLPETFHTCSTPLIVTDAKGLTISSNDAFRALCGHDPIALVGQKPGVILQGKDTNPQAVASLRHAVASGQADTVELINYHADGQPYGAHVEILPVRKDGRVQYFVGASKRVETVTESPKSDEQLRDLLVDLAHSLGAD